MPRYIYQCDNCGEQFQVTHSMSEKLIECTECNTECGEGGTLTRLPCASHVSLKKTNKQTSGHRVEEFIETARSELAEQRSEAKKDYEH